MLAFARVFCLVSHRITVRFFLMKRLEVLDLLRCSEASNAFNAPNTLRRRGVRSERSRAGLRGGCKGTYVPGDDGFISYQIYSFPMPIYTSPIYSLIILLPLLISKKTFPSLLFPTTTPLLLSTLPTFPHPSTYHIPTSRFFLTPFLYGFVRVF